MFGKGGGRRAANRFGRGISLVGLEVLHTGAWAACGTYEVETKRRWMPPKWDLVMKYSAIVHHRAIFADLAGRN